MTINPARYAVDAPIDNSLLTDIISAEVILAGQESGASNACDVPPVPNGSFELDPNVTAQPTGWGFAPFTGGSGVTTYNDSSHGSFSYRVIHPGGAGNGGGTLTLMPNSVTYPVPLPCSISQAFTLRFDTKATLPGIRTKVILRWFDGSGTQIGTDITAKDINGSYPASWYTYSIDLVPVTAPSPARFFQVAFVLGDTSVDPGASTYVYLDHVVLIPRVPFKNHAVMAVGTSTWTVPAGVTLIKTLLVGGGGGGGVGSGFHGAPAAGGGGGYVEGYVVVTPGQALAYTCGSGGTGANNGVNTSIGMGSDQMTAEGGAGVLSQAGGAFSGNYAFALQGEDGHYSLNTGGRCGVGYYGNYGRGGPGTNGGDTTGGNGLLVIFY